MRVFLDDERVTPEGWTRTFWPEESIALLETGQVTELSLDHDLGDDEHGTGYTVLLWIEEAVALRGFKPPRISVHSANSSARKKMERGIEAIERLHQLNTEKEVWSEAGGAHLRSLNRKLWAIQRHLSVASSTIRSSLQDKLADSADLMCDYEIVAKIDYAMREDDPGWLDDDDNFLASRDISLRNRNNREDNRWANDWTIKGSLPQLEGDQVCWLMHDLVDHSYAESPCLSARDCLRIGSIYLDVQVSYQYAFEVGRGE
jgi:hypothetical protein